MTSHAVCVIHNTDEPSKLENLWANIHVSVKRFSKYWLSLKVESIEDEDLKCWVRGLTRTIRKYKNIIFKDWVLFDDDERAQYKVHEACYAKMVDEDHPLLVENKELQQFKATRLKKINPTSAPDIKCFLCEEGRKKVFISGRTKRIGVTITTPEFQLKIRKYAELYGFQRIIDALDAGETLAHHECKNGMRRYPYEIHSDTPGKVHFVRTTSGFAPFNYWWTKIKEMQKYGSSRPEVIEEYKRSGYRLCNGVDIDQPCIDVPICFLCEKPEERTATVWTRMKAATEKSMMEMKKNAEMFGFRRIVQALTPLPKFIYTHIDCSRYLRNGSNMSNVHFRTGKYWSHGMEVVKYGSTKPDINTILRNAGLPNPALSDIPSDAPADVEFNSPADVEFNYPADVEFNSLSDFHTEPEPAMGNELEAEERSRVTEEEIEASVREKFSFEDVKKELFHILFDFKAFITRCDDWSELSSIFHHLKTLKKQKQIPTLPVSRQFQLGKSAVLDPKPKKSEEPKAKKAKLTPPISSTRTSLEHSNKINSVPRAANNAHTDILGALVRDVIGVDEIPSENVKTKIRPFQTLMQTQCHGKEHVPKKMLTEAVPTTCQEESEISSILYQEGDGGSTDRDDECDQEEKIVLFGRSLMS